jgi:alkylhydroperoxidase/carboxymuconolactone decarboxylase family protein YurZ
MTKERELPAAAGKLAKSHPEIWKAYAALGKAAAEAGPLDGKTLRLVKLALAIGASGLPVHGSHQEFDQS